MLTIQVQPDGPAFDYRPVARKCRPLFLGERVGVNVATVGPGAEFCPWLPVAATVERLDDDGRIHAVIDAEEFQHIKGPMRDMIPPEAAAGTRLACEWKHVRYVYPPAGEEEDYTSPRHGGPVPDFNGE